MLTQEGAVMARADCAGPVLDEEDIAYTRAVLTPFLDAADKRTAIECLFGDAAGHTLGFTPRGLSPWAGLALALHDARSPETLPQPAAAFYIPRGGFGSSCVCVCAMQSIFMPFVLRNWCSATGGEAMVGVHSCSEAGGHRHNEDAFCVQAHPLAPDCWLCLVADGQGGQAGGGPAARLACQTALAAAFGCRPEGLIDPSPWPGIFRQADAAVAADAAAGFTTLVGLCIYRSRVVGASCGDSAALLVSGGKAKELSAGQRKDPPVGSEAAFAVPFAAEATEPWRVLVMSDGVWKYVGWDRLAATASRARGAEIIPALQELARLPGSGRFQDDFTVVVLESPFLD
jgi:serine/threonine protein phosphatase PrpC